MCSVEERNKILKQPILKPKDIQVLFDCTKDKSYRYVEMINVWIEQNGGHPLVENGETRKRKAVRTIDYIEFAGLPKELML